MGGGVYTNHKSSNTIELSQLDQDWSDFDAMKWPNPLTHPSIQAPINPPIGEGIITNYKCLNRIELSQLGKVLFNF